MQILAVINQKGGAGKTTLASHVGQAAVEAGKRTLFVDLDPQGSLSLSHPAADGAAAGLTASMLFSTEASELRPERLGDLLALVRADSTLSRLSGNVAGAEKRLAANLRRFADDYDVCVIDTPGAIGFNPPMTVSALVAADAVICPFAVGLYEGRALADLWEYLKVIKTAAYNPRLRLMGLLPSKINTRSPEEVAALDDLRKQFGPIIVPGMLAERAAVKKAVMNRRPVWKNTKGAGHLAAAREWRSVCSYILGNLGESTK